MNRYKGLIIQVIPPTLSNLLLDYLKIKIRLIREGIGLPPILVDILLICSLLLQRHASLCTRKLLAIQKKASIAPFPRPTLKFYYVRFTPYVDTLLKTLTPHLKSNEYNTLKTTIMSYLIIRQLLDDLSDIDLDTRAGIPTIFTFTRSKTPLPELKHFIEDTHRWLHKIPNPKARRLITIYLLILQDKLLRHKWI